MAQKTSTQKPTPAAAHGLPGLDAESREGGLLRRDERVFILGEEVGLYQGACKVTQGHIFDLNGERTGP